MQETSSEKVQYAIDGSVATITLDDRSTRNALGDEMLDYLLTALVEAKDDPSVRVIVVRSNDPKVFSSGGNLKDFTDGRPPVEKFSGLNRFPALFELLATMPKPTVCAAEGDVLAGAFGIALACDFIVAADGTRFGCPEINVGVFPFMISALIYRSMPRSRANELMMTGELLSADQAHRLDIVTRLAAPGEFDDELRRLVNRLASRSPLLMAMGKEALATTADMSLPNALQHLRAQLALAMTTEDVREGVSALFEKREPAWTGR